MTEQQEKLGQAIDRVDNMAHAVTLQLPAEMHVTQLRESLPEIVKELKDAFVNLTGENPWQ